MIGYWNKLKEEKGKGWEGGRQKWRGEKKKREGCVKGKGISEKNKK